MDGHAPTAAGLALGAALGILGMPMLGPLAIVVGVAAGIVIGSVIERRPGASG